MDGWMDDWMDRWMEDGCMVDGWMDGWMEEKRKKEKLFGIRHSECHPAPKLY